MVSPVNRERCDEEKETIDTDYSKVTRKVGRNRHLKKKEGSSAASFMYDC